LIVSSRALEIFEFEKILALFTPYCRTSLGEQCFLKSQPFSGREFLERHHRILEQYRGCTEKEEGFPKIEGIEPLGNLLDKAKESGILFGEELLLFQRIFALGIRIRAFMGERQEEYPDLSEYVKKIRDFQQEHALLGVLDADGFLYDHASPRLGDLRLRIRNLKSKARSLGNSLLNDPSFAGKLQERVLSFRDGRFAVLVKKEHVNSLSGILLYSSSSGNSAYMEPSSLVSLNNELSMAVQEEKEEERRILRELTQAILFREKPVRLLEEVMAFLDLLYAVTCMMAEKKWVLPQIEKKTSFSLRKARHPLLGKSAVPLDLSCGGRNLSIVITGPNTGGKTVALKTVAVAVLLFWYGLPAPVEEGSRIGDFDNLLADIGDEQSITQSLSTFSGHIKNIVAMLKDATERSLVILDELGAGTDPQEGAALGIAILEAFLQRRSLVLATTHHNPLKRYALTTPRIEAASMEFDPVTASPTYRLIVGIPGKSNAILIAERYGLDKQVLRRAREVVLEQSDPLEVSENRLFEKELLLDKKERELSFSLQKVAEKKKDLDEKIAYLEDAKENILRKSDDEARKLLREAEEKAKNLLKLAKTDSGGEAQSRREHVKRDVNKLKKTLDAREEKRFRRKSMEKQSISPAPGMFVEIIDSKVKGEILQVKNSKVTVQAGGLHIEVPFHKVRIASAPEKKDTGKPGRLSSSPSVVSGERIGTSIMIRGMTVDEAMPLMEQYLDKAFRHGYDAVTVIHGRGEGILRREVHRICKSLPYVTSYSLGEPHEGGVGVTIVHFR